MTRPRKPLAQDDPRHGKLAGYEAGCRQRCCLDGHNAYQAARRAAKRAIKPFPILSSDDLTKKLHREDGLGPGFLPRCSCGHTAGEHSVPRLGHPQPCDIPGCRCPNLVRPPIPSVACHEEGPSNLSRARRLA